MTTIGPAQEQFILHWGEMGSRWGINRSVAQIHALLYITGEPLSADQIATQLTMARSNVSTSLRELQAWGLVRVSHRLGDRRDYFEAISDVWEMLTNIVEQKKRREIDPTLEMLRECVAQTEQSPGDPVAAGRMRDLLKLLEQLVVFYDQLRRLSPTAQQKVLGIGHKLGKIVG